MCVFVCVCGWIIQSTNFFFAKCETTTCISLVVILYLYVKKVWFHFINYDDDDGCIIALKFFVNVPISQFILHRHWCGDGEYSFV